MKRVLSAAIAAVVVTVASTSASAVSKLQFDVNGLTVDAGASFGLSHTGTLTLSGSGTLAGLVGTQLAAVLIDDLAVPFSWSSISVSGSISLVLGGVTGGSFTVTVDGTDVYTATILTGSGMVNPQAGQGFTIDGLTFMGTFSSTSWAGVDVSAFDAVEPLNGNFLTLSYSPDAAGKDTSADMEVFVVIPLPFTAGLASLGLAGLACRRQRAIA